MLSVIKKIIPAGIFKKLQPYYHLSLAFISALIYRFPSHHLKVAAITGTKGKTTSTELVSALLEAGGFKTAIVSTLRFKAGDQTERNLLKMTTPGRFFLQKFLRQAVNAGCDYVVMELSSEGAKLYRHAFIDLDALIFTNLSPEHIESHGSYANYVQAKLNIAKALKQSPKQDKVLVVNGDDKEAEKFLAFNIPNKIKFTAKDAEPYELGDDGSVITFAGQKIETQLPGLFNVYNMLGAAFYAQSQGVTPEQIKTALEKFSGVAGRMQPVIATFHKAEQNFEVIVDYAHTADSLKAAYSVYAGKRKLICVLGSCGGGRDKWKRPEMGKVANQYCDEIILTNEDPYDEDPQCIVDDIATGITKGYDIIMDRRDAIHEALTRATPGSVVILTGKGTDPYMMGPNDTKLPWSDADVAQEELDKILA
ncbi:MAG: UDP-N-acetylmuramyl-tripeptide synthetase [Patescibacteria group bacterium]